MATASVDNVKDGLQTVLDWANSQGWTSCTGTVVASDLTPLSTSISNLESCPGLSCQGTLTASDISDMATQTWVNNCGFSKATFSLSGNVLTITTA